MKISGFTFIKNAQLYDFPVVESINSVLPLVDEMVVVCGDSSDGTTELIKAIGSPKIKIIDSVWDTSKFNGGAMIYAEQTDIALRACSGDWCVYIQSDEVLHEDGIPTIRAACEKHLNDERIDGMTLDFVHIYGDYKHYIGARHFGYPLEIRIVRGGHLDIHSWGDAQSFKVMPDFDGISYKRKDGTRKLNCVRVVADIFHYGWSRDPIAMLGKANTAVRFYNPNAELRQGTMYDYGNLHYFPLYGGSQPSAMQGRIKNMNWGELLRYDGTALPERKIFGIKYRVIGFLERTFLGKVGRIGGFKNYRIVSTFKKGK